LSILRSSLFIGLVYISIISDCILFGSSLYSSVFLKNGLLVVLVIISLIPVNNRKELGDDYKGE